MFNENCMIKVKTTCLTAISSLEKIIHPTSASLYFPHQQEKQISRTREWVEDSEAVHETKKRKTNENNTDFMKIQNSDYKYDSSNDTLASEPIEIVIEEESDVSVEVVEMSPLQTKLSIVEEKKHFSLEETIIVKSNSESEMRVKTLCENKILKNDSIEEEIPPTSLCFIKDSNNSDNVANGVKTMTDARTNICSDSVTNTDVPENLASDVSEMLIDFKDEVDNVET